MTIYLATGVEIAIGIAALGLAVVSSILLKPKVPSPVADKSPSTYASRGAYVPLVVGRRRVGAVIGWVGERETKTEGGSGGKGFGGGSSEPEQTIYYEGAWHQLVVGPAVAIHRIWQDGRLIFTGETGPMTPGTTPDGATVDLGTEGRFTLYWGAQNQPANSFLGTPQRVGVTSRWPFCTYIVWNKKRLGQSPRWPTIEYEIEVAPFGTSRTSGGVGVGSGYSPMHILEQLTTAPYPHGAGIDPARIDWTQWNRVATELQGEGYEASFHARDGSTLEQAWTEFAQDLGLALPIRNGLLHPVLVRPPGTDQPLLEADIVQQPLPEIDRPTKQNPKRSDGAVFAFVDRSKNFRDMTVAIDDNGQQEFTDSRRSSSIGIQTTVEYSTAARVGDRRSQEALGSLSAVKIHATRGARMLYAGQTIYCYGVGFLLRVMGVRPEPLSGKVEINAIPDHYGQVDGLIPIPGQTPAPPDPPEGPPATNVLGLPGEEGFFVVTGTPRMAIPWIRPANNVTGAEIHVSATGSSYVLIGTDSHTHWGGPLLDALPMEGLDEVEIGPRYTALGPDEGVAMDLTGSEDQWRLGRQVCTIDDELIYVRRVEAMGAGVYRLRGVLRARRGSRKAAHAPGAVAFVTRSNGVAVWQDAMFTPGTSLSVKVRPLYGTNAPSLASLTAVTRTIQRPIPFGPVSVRTQVTKGRQFVWDAGGLGITVYWEHVAVNLLYAGAGAGMQNAGTAVAGFAPPMGTFDLRILGSDDSVLVERLNVTSGHNVDAPTIISGAGGSTPAIIKVAMRETVGSGQTPWLVYLFAESIT